STAPHTFSETLAYPTQYDLRDRVLEVYRAECRYLESANVSVGRSGLPTASCSFSIPAPFYIQDTGHFNAVEFNICFNQMAYYTMARAVTEGLAPFEEWNIDDYLDRQLSEMFIVDLHSRFRRPVNGKHFFGEIVFNEAIGIGAGSTWRSLAVLKAACR